MSVFPEKSPKIYHFARSAKKFWPAPPLEFVCPPLGNGLGGAGGGKNLGGAMPPLPPYLSRLWLKCHLLFELKGEFLKVFPQKVRAETTNSDRLENTFPSPIFNCLSGILKLLSTIFQLAITVIMNYDHLEFSYLQRKCRKTY